MRFLIIRCIYLYRRFIRHRLNKTCIYHQSCSEFALSNLRSSNSVVSTLLKIYRRITGCKVTQVVTSSTNQWFIVNGHGEKISQNEMSSDALNVYSEVNKKGTSNLKVAKLILGP